MSEPFVARTPVKLSAGKNKDRDNKEDYLLLLPGDELPDWIGGEGLLQLRQGGSVVPKSVWEALHAADTAVERAREAQKVAEDEAAQQMVRSTL